MRTYPLHAHPQITHQNVGARPHVPAQRFTGRKQARATSPFSASDSTLRTLKTMFPDDTVFDTRVGTDGFCGKKEHS
eukprot:3807059-Lingulodinium_polyedra.AAC.1